MRVWLTMLFVLCHLNNLWARISFLQLSIQFLVELESHTSQLSLSDCFSKVCIVLVVEQNIETMFQLFVAFLQRWTITMCTQLESKKKKTTNDRALNLRHSPAFNLCRMISVWDRLAIQVLLLWQWHCPFSHCGLCAVVVWLNYKLVMGLMHTDTPML